MAMPPGNVISSEKMQFPVAMAAAPGVGHWIPDERDGFISWLRSEFAAANAIIDLLCQHLRAVGDPGEYDGVITTIQQRRFNWTPVLHMQQYFPVADVVYTLQQITWKRQQQSQLQPQPQPQNHFVSDQGKLWGREFRRSGAGFTRHGGQRGAEVMVKEKQNSNVDCHSIDQIEKPEEAKLGGGSNGKDMDDTAFSVAEEKRGSGTDGVGKPKTNSGNSKSSGNLDESEGANSDDQVVVNHTCNSDNSLTSEQKQEEKENPASTAKTFVVTEIYEGKTVNIVDGLKLYSELLDVKEVTQLVSLVNDLRVSGRRGQLQGPTHLVYKRPMKGHGREVIQLGLPIADAPIDDDVPSGSSKDRRVEPIPTLLQDVIERLVGMQLMPVKPDACIVDFYNEGDHSQPHMFVPWFARPVCLVFLSECDMTFGRVIVSDHPGDYKGSLKLSLTPGSVLVMEGKSADLAKHAIHSIRKQRVLITFTKSQPKKTISGPNWGSPPSRSPNPIRHHSGHPKHYSGIPVTGVLPTPSPHPPNGVVQPLFITAPLAPPPPMTFPAPPVAPAMQPGSTSWQPVAMPPGHPLPPRMPLPGTGVFLPPGSSNPSTQDLAFPQEKENGSLGKPENGGRSASAEGKSDEKAKEEVCNGGIADECTGKHDWSGDGKQKS